MLIRNLQHAPAIPQATLAQSEAVFGVFKNSTGGTTAIDSVVSLSLSTPDGIKYIQPTTASLNVVLGVADAAIADSAYGFVQLYGYRATSKLLLTDTSQAAGAKLSPVNAQDYLSSIAAGDGRDGFFVLLESHTTGAGTTSKKIHIRAL